MFLYVCLRQSWMRMKVIGPLETSHDANVITDGWTDVHPNIPQIPVSVWNWTEQWPRRMAPVWSELRLIR